MALTKVATARDGDGHWYVIPAWMKGGFNILLNMGEEDDDWDDFEKTFSKYRTGGNLNLIQLYADFDESTNTFKTKK